MLTISQRRKPSVSGRFRILSFKTVTLKTNVRELLLQNC